MFPLINKRETGVNLRRIMDMRRITPKDEQEYSKGGFFMSEKMLVTQVLDERDLLVKKITDKIARAKVNAISRLAGGKPHGCNVGIYFR